MAVLMSLAFLLSAQAASAETRTLKLYFIHTKERAEITFKRNGRYVQSGLDQLNRFLRDWRRNEPAKMDPRLFDLVWEVYRSVGARDYIHVVSAYRSPATNSMLRSRSRNSGVAEKSQHMLGKAMDFYIPGVPLSKLRAAGFKAETGGVGYYPKSGSPFVHLDVGNVRSWPRMSRPELMALFPDGKTIHVPADGKPLGGYQQAMAAYQARKRNGGSVLMASASESAAPRRGLLSALFGGGADEEEDTEETVVAARPQRPARPSAPQPLPGVAAAVAAAPAPPAPVEPAPAPSPEAIIAALPPRAVPLPELAPRPSVDVGAVARPQPVAVAAAEPPARPEEAMEQAVALNIPLPTRRPNFTPPAAVAAEVPIPSEAPVQVASAKPAPNVLATASDATDIIASMTGSRVAEAPSATLAAYVPVPGQRPVASDSAFGLAAAPRPSDPEATAAVRREAEQKTQRLASLASPKAALIARGAGMDAVAAASADVRTTGKTAKPSARDLRPDPRAVPVPVKQEVARWALSGTPVTVNTAGTQAPSFAHDIVRSSPQMVYTAGFQPGGRELDANRFSGKAVTFMSVARFATN